MTRFPYTMGLFNGTIDMDALRQQVGYNPLWLLWTNPQRPSGPQDNLVMQDWADLRRCVKEMLAEIQQLTDRHTDDPQQRALWDLEALYLRRGLDQFLHSNIGRPVNGLWYCMYLVEIIENTANAGYSWWTDQHGLDTIKARLAHLPDEIVSGIQLWFHEESVGWLNYREYEDSLRQFDSLTTDTTRERCLKYWRQWDGDDAAFDEIWKAFVKSMKPVRDMIVAREPTKDIKEMIYTANDLADILKAYGCTDSLEDLLSAAQAQWDELDTIGKRLAAKAGFSGWIEWAHGCAFGYETVPLLENDAAVLAAYKELCAIWDTRLGEAGLLMGPDLPENFRVNFQIIRPDGYNITMAAQVRPGNLSNYEGDPCVPTMLIGGFDQLEGVAKTVQQRAQSLLAPLTALHEWWHVRQYWQHRFTVTRDWVWMACASLPIEGAAFCMEQLALTMQPGDLYLALSVVQHRLQRLARLIVEVMHASGTPFDECVERYIQLSGLHPASAELECRARLSRPLQFSGYVLGAWCLEAIAERYFDGDLAACLAQHHHESGGFVMPSAWAAVRGDAPSSQVSWLPKNNWLAHYIKKTWFSKED